MPPPSFAPRLLDSKPFWPLRVRRLFLHSATTARARPLVLHALSNINLPVLPLPPEVRTVLTVHDLIPFLEPEGVSKAYLWQLRALLPRALKAADKIVCVSEWTQRTLIERYPETASKTVVIHNGCPGLGEGAKARQDREKSPSLRLLYVARHEGYKRLDLYCEILRRRGDTARGVLVTNPSGVAWAKSAASDLIASGRLTVECGLSNSAYQRAFRDADVYVSASRLEGFCLPAADALASGIPVVYQTGSGLDEVAGRTCAVALAPASTLGDWVKAVGDAELLAASPAFPEDLRRHVASLPTWKDAATALQSLYDALHQLPRN